MYTCYYHLLVVRTIVIKHMICVFQSRPSLQLHIIYRFSYIHVIMNGLNNVKYLGQNKMGSRMGFRNENNASMQCLVIEYSLTLYKWQVQMRLHGLFFKRCHAWLLAKLHQLNRFDGSESNGMNYSNSCPFDLVENKIQIIQENGAKVIMNWRRFLS